MDKLLNLKDSVQHRQSIYRAWGKMDGLKKKTKYEKNRS